MGSLEQVLDAEEEVETDESDGGASPDHEGAFPSERAGDLLQAVPRDHERFVVGAFHQNDGRVRIENVGLGGGWGGVAIRGGRGYGGSWVNDHLSARHG